GRRGCGVLEWGGALGIMALIAGLALPFFSGSQGRDGMRAASREVVRALQETRSAAILHNRVERFAADTAEGTFSAADSPRVLRLPLRAAMRLYTHPEH